MDSSFYPLLDFYEPSNDPCLPSAFPEFFQDMPSTERPPNSSCLSATSPPNSKPHNPQPLRDSQDEHTPPAGPPPMQRKRRAPTLRADAWELHKDRIIELYTLEHRLLREVREIMERECNFTATYVSTRSDIRKLPFCRI